MAASILVGVITVFHSSSVRPAFLGINNNNNNNDNERTRADRDEVYHAWEAAIFENGKKSMAANNLDFFSAGLVVENYEGVLDKLLYLNHTHAFDQLKTDGVDSSSLDFFYYQNGWEAQINQAYCAVASSAAVLNSLRGKIKLPQDEVYIPFQWATQTQLMLNECVKQNLYDVDKMHHLFWGMGLKMATKLLQCHLEDQGYSVEAHHVDPQQISMDEVRQGIKEAVLDPEARVIINYDRGGIGQGDMGHGHFSPIGAYNHEIDAFLVMDVAKYKYPPVWVTTKRLFGGISGLDFCADFVYDKLPDNSLPRAEFAKIIDCKPAFRGFAIIKPTV